MLMELLALLETLAHREAYSSASFSKTCERLNSCLVTARGSSHSAERVKSGIANARNKKPSKSWGRKLVLTQETAASSVKMRNSLTRDLIHVSTEIESFYVDVALQSVKSATGKE